MIRADATDLFYKNIFTRLAPTPRERKEIKGIKEIKFSTIRYEHFAYATLGMKRILVS